MVVSCIVVFILFGVVLNSACFMVGGDNNKSFAVFLCIFNGGLYGVVKSHDALGCAVKIIVMRELVDAGAFNHEEEAVIVVIKKVDCLFGHFGNGRRVVVVLAVFQVVKIKLS